MPFLPRKLQKTAQKWRAMVKRRNDPEDDAPHAFQASQCPKQQHVMTNKWPGGAPNSTTSPSLLDLFPVVTNTPAAHPFPVFWAMGNYQSYGVYGSPEVGGDLGTAENPIADIGIRSFNEDLTESPAGSGSFPEDPVDLTTEMARNTPVQPELGALDLASQFSGAMDIDEEKTTQIYNDQLLAQRVQEESYHQGDELLALRFPRRLSAGVDPLGEYREELQSKRCAKCRAPLKIKATEVIQRTRKMLKESRFFHPCFCCGECRSWSCVGGHEYYTSEFMPVLKHVASTKLFKSTWCCDQGRLFLIFCLLCGPEPIPSPPPRKQRKSATKPGPSSATAAHPDITSVLKQPQLSKGTGYGGDVKRSRKKGGRQQVRRDDNDIKGILELYFQGLASLLPSAAKRTTRFDSLPHPVLSLMLSKSPMMQHAAELLRHAAIEEISTRYGSVTAVLDFLETAGGHFDTCTVLCRRRNLFPPMEQLVLVVLGDGKTPRSPGPADYETSQSLAAIVNHLAVPCRKFLETSRRADNMSVEDEDQSLLTVLQRICKIADWLGLNEVHESAKLEPSSFCRPNANVTTGDMRATAETMSGSALAGKMSDWHRANCVKEVADDTILKNSHFMTAAIAAANSKPAAGRMRKLLSQVSSLSTDLPDGIYVRHGESRLDVLKILIIGPADTPYEHGLFEFDMFCGNEFPNKPPMMFFRTTGGGVARFNPNLYACGKVCLSLLGTWSGQPWEPESSTILQILVSIQGMIFNEQPYYNEPGYEYNLQPERAEQYNRSIERLTVQHAILPWLTQRLAGRDREAPTTVASEPSIANTNSSLQNAAHHLSNPAAAPPHTLNEPIFDTHLTSAAADPPQPGNWPPWTTTPVNLISAATGEISQQGPALSQALAESISAAFYTPSVESIQLFLKGLSGITQEAEAVAYRMMRNPSPPTEDDPIWGDVVRKLFEFKAQTILKTVQKWEQRPGDATKPSMSTVCRELEDQLRRHGFSEKRTGPNSMSRLPPRTQSFWGAGNLF